MRTLARAQAEYVSCWCSRYCVRRRRSLWPQSDASCVTAITGWATAFQLFGYRDAGDTSARRPLFTALTPASKMPSQLVQTKPDRLMRQPEPSPKKGRIRRREFSVRERMAPDVSERDKFSPLPQTPCGRITGLRVMTGVSIWRWATRPDQVPVDPGRRVQFRTG